MWRKGNDKNMSNDEKKVRQYKTLGYARRGKRNTLVAK